MHSHKALLSILVFAMLSSWVQGGESALQNSDIGTVATAGGASFADGVLKINGVGNGMATTADSFHYVWQAMSNRYIVQALLDPQDGAEAALAIRESETDASSPGLWVGFSKERGITLSTRTSKGGEVKKVTFSADGSEPLYLRLSRREDEIDLAYSENGEEWQSIEKVQISLPDRTIAGFAIAASAVSEAAFSSVKIENTEELIAETEAETTIGSASGTTAPDQTGGTTAPVNETPDVNTSSVEENTVAEAGGSSSSTGVNPRKIYVNKVLGSDACDGTSSLRSGFVGPKKTISAAVELAGKGDEIVVSPGTYTLSELNPTGEISITPVGEVILEPEPSAQ